MAEIVTLPKLGISDEGELVSWEAELGETVQEGDIIAVFESEKAAAEVKAPATGVLLETYLEEGDIVQIEPGRPIAVIGEEGETPPSLEEVTDGAAPDADSTAATAGAESSTAASESGGAPDQDVKATPRAQKYAREHDIDMTAVDGTGPQGAITEDDLKAHEPAVSGERDSQADTADAESIKATPRAKKLAEELDVSLQDVEGTGPQGSITEEDVETDEESTQAGGTEEKQVTVIEREELTGTRKTIADRLSSSAREKPHVMGTRDISIEQLQQVREKLEATFGADVSLNDLLLKCVARTLEDQPQFNAHFVDGGHERIEEVNIGYAVDSPKGLIVPVVPNVDEKPVDELAADRRNLVQRTLNDEHTMADLDNGTFTVTNVGVFNIDVSYSIINPPQVAILAIGQRKPALFDRDGEYTIEEAITFSLTIDHRVLDGGDTGAFLETLAKYVEHPGFLLTE